MEDTKSKVFVIMPFQDVFFEVYEMISSEFSEKFEFSHAADEDNQQNILADIIQPIYEADVIIADLTGLNPNVLYELGVAHTFNKKTIVITQDDLNTLPFDLKQYRAKDYSTHFKKFAELIEHLKTCLNGAISGDVVYSNPVKDFIDQNKIDIQNNYSNDKIQLDLEDGEKGFIDFLADIEEDTETLTTKINDMTDEMNKMSSGVSACTSEIDRVNKTGGSGTANFIRKQTKKVASYLSTFSGELKKYNVSQQTLWDRIEKNTLGLIENKFAGQENNKQSLIDYLKSLKGLQKNVIDNKTPFTNLKETFLQSLGMERTLNQTIRFMDEDLTTYLSLMDQMCASIDRIIDKSKFVVGDIDFENTDAETEETKND